MLFLFLTLNTVTFSVITSQDICWLSFLLPSQATHSVWGDGKLTPSVCWFVCFVVVVFLLEVFCLIVFGFC